MRRYETVFIVRPNVAEDEIEAVINKTSSIIEGDGGTIIRIDKWGLKKLAYLIKKETQGYYVHIDYAAIPASVSELERIFRIDDKVLKYLTVKLDDSCDPEAIKEELAEAEVKEEESIPSESTESPAKEEAKEEASPSEPAESPAKKEAKEEASPSEPAESPAKEEAKEEASPSEEKQAE